ncbi:MAG: hypothetical protein CSA62_04010 [Planctomycetota bacterium]|nr:MAG: hypothetical protein CSA62_04010 [Planctomycetota bacterium]
MERTRTLKERPRWLVRWIFLSVFVIGGAALWRVSELIAGPQRLVEFVLWALVLLVLLPGLVSLLYFREEAVVASFGTALDESTKSLQRSESQLYNVLQSVVDPIVVIDHCGGVLECNAAVQEVFGWSREQLCGQNVKVLMAEPYRSEHDGYIERYLKDGIPRAIGKVRRVVGIRKNGQQFPCEISISEMREAGNVEFVGIVRDIAEREQMNSMLVQAERLAAVGELAAGVAHEVNNPINTILNCAQLIQDGDEDEVLIEDIVYESKRIASIVRDLLDFARDRQDDMSSVHIEQVISRTLSLVARRIEKQGIQVELSVPKQLPIIHARSQQLQQVLLNLILNARDALTRGLDAAVHDDLRIHIAAAEIEEDEGRWVRISVRDNGIGIDPSVLDRIFQPFFTTKRGSGGTGLGLSVSMGIVRGHHGRLSVVSGSEFGDGSLRGAEFRVDLPVPDDDWDSEEEQS